MVAATIAVVEEEMVRSREAGASDGAELACIAESKGKAVVVIDNESDDELAAAPVFATHDLSSLGSRAIQYSIVFMCIRTPG